MILVNFVCPVKLLLFIFVANFLCHVGWILFLTWKHDNQSQHSLVTLLKEYINM